MGRAGRAQSRTVPPSLGPCSASIGTRERAPAPAPTRPMSHRATSIASLHRRRRRHRAGPRRLATSWHCRRPAGMRPRDPFPECRLRPCIWAHWWAYRARKPTGAASDTRCRCGGSAASGAAVGRWCCAAALASDRPHRSRGRHRRGAVTQEERGDGLVGVLHQGRVGCARQLGLRSRATQPNGRVAVVHQIWEDHEQAGVDARRVP